MTYMIACPECGFNMEILVDVYDFVVQATELLLACYNTADHHQNLNVMAAAYAPNSIISHLYTEKKNDKKEHP